jgi:hypothetical protein
LRAEGERYYVACAEKQTPILSPPFGSSGSANGFYTDHNVYEIEQQ